MQHIIVEPLLLSYERFELWNGKACVKILEEYGDNAFQKYISLVFVVAKARRVTRYLPISYMLVRFIDMQVLCHL